MEIVHEPAVRGRLNVLVQMFEKQSKNEEKSSTTPLRPKKLAASKFQPILRPVNCETDSVVDERRVDASTFSVNKLIKTFDARPGRVAPFIAHRKCHSSGDLQRRSRASSQPPTPTRAEFPEVKSLLDGIFCRLVEFHRRSLSMDSRCSSERDLADDARSYLTDSTDIETSVSTADASFVFNQVAGKIGSLWTANDPFAFLERPAKAETSRSDVRQLCTKKLSQYLEVLNARTVSEAQQTSEDFTAELSDTVKLLMSRLEGEDMKEDAILDRTQDVSVRTCKALIEMTVCVGEPLKPTINVVNRSPCLPAFDDCEDTPSCILFSTDDPCL